MGFSPNERAILAGLQPSPSAKSSGAYRAHRKKTNLGLALASTPALSHAASQIGTFLQKPFRYPLRTRTIETSFHAGKNPLSTFVDLTSAANERML
jgi:hypothetical protein